MLNHIEFMATNEQWVMYLGSTCCEEHSAIMGWYVHVNKHISIQHILCIKPPRGALLKLINAMLTLMTRLTLAQASQV